MTIAKLRRVVARRPGARVLLGAASALPYILIAQQFGLIAGG